MVYSERTNGHTHERKQTEANKLKKIKQTKGRQLNSSSILLSY